jgi:hypothetical protein
VRRARGILLGLAWRSRAMIPWMAFWDSFGGMNRDENGDEVVMQLNDMLIE